MITYKWKLRFPVYTFSGLVIAWMGIACADVAYANSNADVGKSALRTEADLKEQSVLSEDKSEIKAMEAQLNHLRRKAARGDKTDTSATRVELSAKIQALKIKSAKDRIAVQESARRQTRWGLQEKLANASTPEGRQMIMAEHVALEKTASE